MTTAFSDYFTLNKVTVGESNDQIRTWSISVLVTLLYTCIHLNRTMLFFTAFCDSDT